MLGLKHYRDRYELGRSESRLWAGQALVSQATGKVLEVAVGTGQDFVSQRILDCGCGEGRFCRLLATRGGAYILGLDLCSLMIEAAEAMKSRCDEYRVADVQKLGFLDSETFDLAVSYLNQCDLPDFHANNREVFRVLKHGGRFIVANLHPLKSAVGGWQRLTMERSFTSFSTDTSRKVSASETC